jgi:glycosyltransferase involved in cell wall biosynthesis
MRVLHVIPQFPFVGGSTVIGGHASALLALADAQARAGTAVEILSYVHGRSGTIAINERLHVHCIFDQARPGSVGFGLRLRRAAGRWVAAHRDEFDVIHSHSGFVEYLVVAARARAAAGRPTLHTLYCPIPREGGRARLPFVHGLLRRSARGLDGLTAMSRNVADSMQDYGLGPVEAIPPALNIDRFHPVADAGPARRRLGLEDDEVAILFVGNAKPQKNMIGVLRAFDVVRRAHPRTRLVVTTELKQSSSDEHLAVLQRTMDELDLADATIQLGIVENMPELMQACDVLAAPFLDSFGPSDYFMAVLEAMACGRPVVVSRVGGMPEVVSDEVGRLVDPHDHEALAAALTSLVADADLRRSTGDRARSYTETHFDPRAVAARYGTLYETIAP